MPWKQEKEQSKQEKEAIREMGGTIGQEGVTVFYAHTWKMLAMEALLSGAVCQLLCCGNIHYRNSVREKELILTHYFCPS